MSSRGRGATKGKHHEKRQRETYFDRDTGRLILSRLDMSDQGGFFNPRRFKGTRKGR